MFNALRDHEHFSSRHMNGAITQVDAQLAVNYNERFISIFVIMPYEIALQFHNFELVVVHLGNDLRLPLLGKEAVFLIKIDRLVAHVASLRSGVSNHDPLDLIEADFIASATVELRRAR